MALYDGVISSVNVIPGEFVQQNQVVVTLVTLLNADIRGKVIRSFRQSRIRSTEI